MSKPQPPRTEPVWQGRTDGAVFDCVVTPMVGRGVLVAGWTIQFWSASARPAPPDPAVLARQAVDSMQLRAITVGVVPESRPGSIGLVGMPNWMWVEQPSENSWGPISRSASAAGWTVTATGRVARVSWDMGDGVPVVCAGPGTPYEDRFGKTKSPTCGHTYTRQGSYMVRATSHWVITWAGIGQGGTITMDLTQAVPVTIGEVQVLLQYSAEGSR